VVGCLNCDIKALRYSGGKIEEAPSCINTCNLCLKEVVEKEKKKRDEVIVITFEKRERLRRVVEVIVIVF
jgi:hypothetical protein